MSSNLWPFILLLGFGVAQANQAPEPADGLTPAETTQLAKEQKIDGRIKVYLAASERHRAAISTEMAKHQYPEIPNKLQSWEQLLKTSLKDIDASITNRKKKSKTLIRYEIQLRKSITEAQAYKTNVPVDVIDPFDAWLNQAEDVHQKFVDILFPK
jgi:hypothetical protein